jgi:hypothetical protein
MKIVVVDEAGSNTAGVIVTLDVILDGVANLRYIARYSFVF